MNYSLRIYGNGGMGELIAGMGQQEGQGQGMGRRERQGEG